MLARLCQRIPYSHYATPRLYHQFSTACILHEKPLPPRRTIDDSEITESFLKGSGPGGQKINKTNSAVQLKHLPTGIVIKCQETRSREQNRKFARRILGEKLDEMENGDESRNVLKAERARKRKASADKKARRKYKKLEDGKRVEGSDAEVDGESFDTPDGSDPIKMEDQTRTSADSVRS